MSEAEGADLTSRTRCPGCGRLRVDAESALCVVCLLRLGSVDSESTDSAGQSNPSRPEWMRVRGSRIGAYEPLDEIARGGMGLVYRARQLQPSRIVALKMMLPYLATSTSMRARFRIESDAVARLDHPNILPVYEVGEHESLPYFSMKFAEGGSLLKRLPRLAGQWREIAAMMVKVGNAIQHAHDRGILHRDLKPGNILFDGRDEPMVADFGLAKFRAVDHNLTLPAAVLGSPYYMAPEQVSGSFGDIGPATDVYSLGAILYELLAQRPPIQGSDAVATLRLITSAVPDSGLRVAPLIPAWLDAIALKCLEKDAAKRYPTASALVEDIERWLRGKRPVAAHAPKLLRYGWAIAGAVLLSVATTVGMVRRPFSNGPVTPAIAPEDVVSEKSVAVLPFTDESAAKDQDYYAEGLSAELIDILTQVAALRVPARPSSFSFKGKTDDEKAIAHKLKVAYLLEGTAHNDADRVRVTARLIRASDGAAIWTKVFNRVPGDIFDIQRELAGAVVKAFGITLNPRERLASAHRTVNTAAYSQYLHARQLYYGGSTGGFEAAAMAYEEAIRLDPEFAAAYAGLAEATVYLVHPEPGQPTSYERPLRAATRAIALSPELADGYSARCLARELLSWDWDGAMQDIANAARLDPNSSTMHRRRGLLLGSLGRFTEAISALRKAADLDPFIEGNWTFLGFFLSANGQYTESRDALHLALAVLPRSMVQTRYYLGLVDLREGHPQDALGEFTLSMDDNMREAGIALAEYSLGQGQKSRSVLEALIRKHGHDKAYLIGAVYAWRGENDKAFQWLERAYEQRNIELSRIKADPVLFRIRTDPRYRALLQKLNLPL